MWFDLRRCDPDLQGPETLRWQLELPAPPREVFAVLEDASQWPRWFPAIDQVTWLTPEPHGVGSLRRVDLRLPLGPGRLSIIEHFTAWQPPGDDTPGRITFFLSRASLPLAAHFAEDYRLTPRADGGCHLDWSVHYRVRRPLRLLHPLIRPSFAGMFDEATAQLGPWLARRSGAEV